MEVGGQRHAPAALPLGNRPSTHCTGGHTDLRADLGGCGSLSATGIRSRNFQPVANRYNHYAIPSRSAVRNIITVDYKLVQYYWVERDRTGCKQLYNLSYIYIYIYIIAERQKVGCKDTFFVHVNRPRQSGQFVTKRFCRIYRMLVALCVCEIVKPA